MITDLMYFGDKPHSQQDADNCDELLKWVNALLQELGWTYPKDPDTDCPISGARGGSGDGGFRLHTSTTGAMLSTHKKACAVDVYDPDNRLDNLITDELLARFNLYREHPKATPGWCHLQSLPPKSGKRTYIP